jgi:NAD(P)-dependent dehydrogenase (short-subunit alcohol dehydrogenase family)
MKLSLTGQTVAITGAANGIGLAIARSFLEAGAGVLALDLDPIALAGMKEEAPDRIRTIAVNVADLGALREAVADESVDHLVCAAAVGSGKTGFPFWNLDPSDWGRVLDVSLMGVVNTVHAFVPALLACETSRKSVLLISSVAGQIGSQTDPPYSAAKAAVINFAQLAAKDFAPYGIRVNALSPGMVKTELNRAVFNASREADSMSYEDWADAKIRRVSPLGRWQEASEFGAMAVFLASDHARNLTGQTLNIDGGQVMHS